MIHVIATISIKPDFKEVFLDELRRIIEPVRAEQGCVEYQPTIDIKSGIDTQLLGDSEVVIVEKWQCLDDLHAHRQASHLLEYKQRTQDMVKEMSIRVLTPIDLARQ